MVIIVLVVDISDDFFQKIFERHESEHRAVPSRTIARCCRFCSMAKS